ncbi:MAG: hypothetical protein CO034_02980 [Parcubacteria group bacterium CG_4_9_14_0_2_um_filter_35_11]|nr:MAG: hypothetical protein CO034_02980 [Parcubacteria group bacterium CG_4_9_14_0_2_um_filter_35_11]
MKTKIFLKDKSYNIEISEIKENLLKVRVENEDYFFSKDEFDRLVLIERKDYPSLESIRKSEVVPNLPQEKEIKTPIAGIVSKIHVKDGETIRIGQPVITLVAMKMENEIISESYGRVKEIEVKEKQFVNSGEKLIILE